MLTILTNLSSLVVCHNPDHSEVRVGHCLTLVFLALLVCMY
jgi:hypothetical protein